MGGKYAVSFIDEEGDTLFKIYGTPIAVEISDTANLERQIIIKLDDNSRFEIIAQTIEEDNKNYIIDGWTRIEAVPNGIIHQGYGTILMDALVNSREANKHEIPMDLYIPPEAKNLLKKFYSSFDRV